MSEYVEHVARPDLVALYMRLDAEAAELPPLVSLEERPWLPKRSPRKGPSAAR